MHARERDFLVSGRSGPLHFADHISDREAPAASTGARNDAVAAALFTAGLHPERERGTARDSGLERRTARSATVAESHAGRNVAAVVEQPKEIQLLVVPHHAEDAGKGGNILFAAGGVAASDDDPGSGVLPGN